MNLLKLKEQIEFYFSNANYSKDKFMLARAAENDGFIDISILLTFKRLKAMDPTVDQIKEAVKDSKVVEIKDNSLRKIQNEDFKEYLNDQNINKRVAYISGFNINSDLDNIKELLNEYCKPIKITMRRSEARVFRGSCFVEFSTKEEVEELLKIKIESNINKENDNPKKLKKEPTYLEILTKEEYLLSKKDKKENKKDEAFGEKVKLSFIPKLYNFLTEKEFDIKEIKENVRDCAFVDIPKKVIRMKFAEDWKEKEFEIKESDYKIKLIRMNEEEAKEYLKGITIKRLGKYNK